jgi:hypothetical protein
MECRVVRIKLVTLDEMLFNFFQCWFLWKSSLVGGVICFCDILQVLLLERKGMVSVCWNGGRGASSFVL